MSPEKGLEGKIEFLKVKSARIEQRVLFDKSLMERRNRFSVSVAAHDVADCEDIHLKSWISQLNDSE